jgi:hypothetical protein
MSRPGADARSCSNAQRAEAGVLLKDVGRGGLRGCRFVSAVHALVPPMRLGMARGDALQMNPAPQSPHGEVTQPAPSHIEPVSASSNGRPKSRTMAGHFPHPHAPCLRLTGCVMGAVDTCSVSHFTVDPALKIETREVLRFARAREGIGFPLRLTSPQLQTVSFGSANTRLSIDGKWRCICAI